MRPKHRVALVESVGDIVSGKVESSDAFWQ